MTTSRSVDSSWIAGSACPATGAGVATEADCCRVSSVVDGRLRGGAPYVRDLTESLRRTSDDNVDGDAENLDSYRIVAAEVTLVIDRCRPGWASARHRRGMRDRELRYGSYGLAACSTSTRRFSTT